MFLILMLPFLCSAQSFMKAARPLLRKSGVPQDLVELLETNAEAELMSARRPQYIRVQNVYAIKKR